ncbi:MAG: peptide chain release factor N(5)-glutamine methyltransferase, partial [Colwellia sp.]
MSNNTELSLDLTGDNSIANLLIQSQILLNKTSDSAKLDADILLSLALKKERSYLLTWPEKQISNEQLADYLSLLIRRMNGEPIAYITGIKEFWSLSFFVSTDTLIPRPDTETLIELVLTLYHGNEGLSCLDLGTGTGAIALALASEKPSWKIEAIDYNQNAIALAQKNAKHLNLSQVDIYQSDWFSSVEKHKTFDLIVSNPPYIDSDDENLNQGDIRFEPISALVAKDQGLADIKFIAEQAVAYLKPQGKLFFEHGFEQGQVVRDILIRCGYKKPKTEQDLNGHDRITWATLPK